MYLKLPNFITCRCIKPIVITKMSIKTFVFLDSETSGLPFEENNKTRMTELCLIAVQSDHLTMGIFPRVQDKISLCFNPRKFINPAASDITGLTNEQLEFQPEFNANFFKIMQDFLDIHAKPICLVAHNGDRFDYPILRAEINKTGNALSDDILCADSLLAFRELLNRNSSLKNEISTPIKKGEPIEFQDEFEDVLIEAVDEVECNLGMCSKKLTVEEIQRVNETTPVKQVIPAIVKNTAHRNAVKVNGLKKRKLFNVKQPFKLTNLYQTLTGKDALEAHRAEYDVNMIIECAAKVGQEFVDWCNSNSKKFCDIPMMVPGRPFGK